MDRTDRLELLKISLANTMDALTCDYLLNWLDSLPEDFHFSGIADLVVALIGYQDDPGAYGDYADWAYVQEIWASVVRDAVVTIRDGQIGIFDTDSFQTVQIEIPDWIMRLDGLIRFLADARGGRIPTAGELKELLVSLWFPQFC